MNILFTCAGRRNYLINYFKDALKGYGKVFATDMKVDAPALIEADVAIQVPGVYDSMYIESLKEIITSNNIDAVISLNDLELPILAEKKEELEALGTKLIIADENAIKIAFDKWHTCSFLEYNGLKYPKTYINYQEAHNALKTGELTFPVVLKPRWGSGSISIDFPEDLEEFELAYKLQKMRIGRTILKEASNEDFEHSILIQEKIQGVEYGMDVLNDLEGNYIGTYVRQKLSMRAGETDSAISIIDKRFDEIGKKLSAGLKHIGNLDCDVFEYNNELYVLELNPRFGGGYPFSHEAGINTAAIYIEWLNGNKNISHFDNYKAGLSFAKCDRLIPLGKKS